MAQKVLVTVLDDTDGSEGAETREFSLDGVAYEIDLVEDNYSELRACCGVIKPQAARVIIRTNKRS